MIILAIYAHALCTLFVILLELRAQFVLVATGTHFVTSLALSESPSLYPKVLQQMY